MTVHELPAAAYLELVGPAEGPHEVDPETYRRIIAGNPVRADDLVPRRTVNQEPEAKTEFHDWLASHGLDLETEYLFHPDRKWRLDFAYPSLMLAFEYDGLMRRGENQGHASISGILRDVEKTNAAQLLGWVVIRVNAKNLSDGTGYEVAARAIAMRKERSVKR